MNNQEAMVQRIKQQYPPGTRIRLDYMRDPYAPVEPGTMGTVDIVDDAGQIHMSWDNGRTLAVIPGEDSFTVIRQELQPMKLYMPLHGDIYERNRYGDLVEYPDELEGQYLTEYQDAILAAMVKNRLPEEQERGLMHWYGETDSVNDKVSSAVFSVEEHNGTLYGTVECLLSAELTPDEMEDFKEYISGQASDAWGEGFEQRNIRLPDSSVLNVHLWDSGSDWSIMTEEEFQSSHGQEYGGMHYGQQM
jgi:hypothetical protein